MRMLKERTLTELWMSMTIKSDKGDIHSYIPLYEELLRPYRETAKNVLEIGVFNGASILLWEEYFTVAKVYGMDCDLLPHGGLADLRLMIADGTHNIAIGDASNPAHIEKYFKGIKFDVVIEDANHDVDQQLQIYAALKTYMAEGSIYIIEDIQNIDETRAIFNAIGGEVIDRRHIKNRYDDTLIIIRS